jgi:hypothetical protein
MAVVPNGPCTVWVPWLACLGSAARPC